MVERILSGGVTRESLLLISEPIVDLADPFLAEISSVDGLCVVVRNSGHLGSLCYGIALLMD